MRSKDIGFVAILWLIGGVACAQTPGGPDVLHATDAQPGHVMIVSGGGYDPETVRVIVHVPGTLTAERDALPDMIKAMADEFDGNHPAPPLEPPTEQTHTLTPLHASKRSVFVRLPAHPYPPGYTAIVWLKDGEQLSRPIFVNQPAAWFLLKTTSRPGEMNRLCGWNLRGDRYVPRYLFLRGAACFDHLTRCKTEPRMNTNRDE